MMIGLFRPADSFLHRLDPRAKLAPVLLVLVLAFFASSLWFPLGLLSILIILLLCAGISGGTIVKSFAPILLLAVVTGFYHLIFTGRESSALLTIAGWSVTVDGAYAATYFTLRLMLFVAVVFLVTLTTGPSDIAATLVWLARPLAALRVPINDFGLMMFIAVRFIPVLRDEFIAIRHAQWLRGLGVDGSWSQKIRNSVALIVPVFTAALSRADELALAIENRGYRSHAPRTVYSHFRFGRAEWLYVVLSGAVIVALFAAVRAA